MPVTLSRRARYWTSAGVIVHTLWTSGAAVMTYPLYAAQWHLSSVTTTAIYAVFPIVVVVVLVGCGDLSDFIGRRNAILLGLGFSLSGIALFAVAPSVAYLFAGRALMGIGVGLTAGAAAAALLESSSNANGAQSGAVTSAAQSLGFVLATLVGGAMVQYAPFPTHLPFWTLFTYVAIVFAVAWFLPRGGAAVRSGRWRPRGVEIPQAMRGLFAFAALAGIVAYTIGALLLALGAQVARDLVGSDNALVNGATLSLFPIVSCAVSLCARRLPVRQTISAGAAAAVVSMVMMVLATIGHSIVYFLAASTTAGIAFGALFLGALTIVNANAPPDRRGGTLSALYLSAYLAQGVYALALGWLARLWGLERAVEVGAALIAAVSISLFSLAGTSRSAAFVESK